jgi:hypothetical protein
MGHVNPKHVGTGTGEFGEPIRSAAGGSNGRDDFGARPLSIGFGGHNGSSCSVLVGISGGTP